MSKAALVITAIGTELVQDLDVPIIDAATGELLGALTIDPSRDCQPTGCTLK